MIIFNTTVNRNMPFNTTPLRWHGKEEELKIFKFGNTTKQNGVTTTLWFISIVGISVNLASRTKTAKAMNQRTSECNSQGRNESD